MGAQLGDGTVEIADVTVRPGQHHAPFHRDEDELGEAAAIDGCRPRHGREAFLDRAHPVLEIRRKGEPYRRVGLVQLPGEAADRAAIETIGRDDCGAVAGE